MNTLLQRCKDLGLDAEIVEAAGRYRFIRNADHPDRRLLLDAAIDAAMQQEQQQ